MRYTLDFGPKPFAPEPLAKRHPVTLPARLRAHEPAAIRDVYDAIVNARGVLADIGTELRLTGSADARAAQAERLVALAGLGAQLSAVQQQRGTGLRVEKRPLRFR
jgi:hypothetical protein